jgi:hypothetical protein
MKRLVIAVLVAGSILAHARSNLASTCIIPEVPKAYEQARAVFLGEVEEIIEPVKSNEALPLSRRLFTIRFRVEKAWKGVFTSSFEVLSSQGEGNFGFPQVRKGERYVVYADPLLENGVAHPHKTIVSACNRTAGVSNSQARHGFQLSDTFDRTNSVDEKILDWRYPPLMFW